MLHIDKDWVINQNRMTLRVLVQNWLKTGVNKHSKDVTSTQNKDQNCFDHFMFI